MMNYNCVTIYINKVAAEVHEDIWNIWVAKSIYKIAGEV